MTGPSPALLPRAIVTSWNNRVAIVCIETINHPGVPTFVNSRCETKKQVRKRSDAFKIRNTQT